MRYPFVARACAGMAGNAASDVWYYAQAAIPNIGSWNSSNGKLMQVAVLNITSGVCAEINNRAQRPRRLRSGGKRSG